MFKNETNIVERIKFKKANISRLIYAVVFAVWLIGYFLIKNVEQSNSWANVYYAFGLAFVAVSFATALVIKQDRDKTLNFFKFGMLGYSLFICLFELILYAILAGGSDGNAYSILNSLCSYSKILIPLGLILYQAKKWTFLTGINKNKRDTIDSYKRHGNDGLN